MLEEAPRLPESQAARPYQLLITSAKTDSAAELMVPNLVSHLQEHPELNLADVAFTCQVGREAFPHRRAVVVEGWREGVIALAERERRSIVSGRASETPPGVVFQFSGQGSQYVNMGRDLYEHEPVFRETLDLCAQQLMQPLGLDLRLALYPPKADEDAATERLNQTWLTQPALRSCALVDVAWHRPRSDGGA